MKAIATLAVLLCLAPALVFAATCRLALSVGLDISDSVDAREFRLQRDGLAWALLQADVQALIFAMPSAPVRLMIFEWSGPEDVVPVVGWRSLNRPADLEQIADRLRTKPRPAVEPSTALGVAMRRGDAFLAQQPTCWQRTLDLTGDGKRNIGPHPRDVTISAGTTINALVVGADAPAIGDVRQLEISELSSYFRVNVLRGPDSFVQTSLGFEAFADAMHRKLKRELDTLRLSENPNRYNGSDRSNTVQPVSVMR